MALQISTFTNEEESSPAFRNGFVLVDGEAVTARFHFGKCHGCDLGDAERQALQFVAAADMLAALRVAERTMRALGRHYSADWGVSKTAEMISAAIAKAEGRA